MFKIQNHTFTTNYYIILTIFKSFRSTLEKRRVDLNDDVIRW